MFDMVLVSKISDYLRFIKFSHTVFALPFAFTSALIAADGFPSYHQIFWITVAMVSGRSGAMGMNRIIDRKIDAINPRTKNRELPKGIIKTGEALAFTLISFAFLVLSAYKLNPLCLKISPVVLMILLSYSFTKRFTWLCHMVLGLALSLAPLGAWIAVKGSFDIEIIPLCLAVMFWGAGFDVLYGLQDIDFDREYGVYSIPSVFGVTSSLWLARFFHFIAAALLFSLIPLFNLSLVYAVGIMLVSGFMLYEHSLITPDDISKLNLAFFNMNGYISITVFVFTLFNYMIS